MTALSVPASRSEKKEIIRGLIVLGAPIALQNLIGSSLNLLDSVMIGSLGTPQIAGVAIANQIFFLLNLFMFGVGSGTMVFTAQYWGNRDNAGIQRGLGLCLVVTMCGAGIFFSASQAAPGWIISLFSTDPVVIGYGGRFLRIVSFGFLFQAVSAAFSYVLRSIERTRMPLVAGSISLLLNTFLNWGLIFGNLGMPKLGVEGSGFATATARLVEMLIILGAVYGARNRSPLAAGFRQLFAFNRAYLKKYFTVILPVVGNEFGWALGVALEAVVFGHMGTESIAAYNIADTAIKLVIVAFMGTTSANAIIVGKRIGEGDIPGAMRTADYCTRIAPLMGAAMGLALVGLSFVVPLLFNVTPAVRSLARIGMIIFGCAMPVRITNWHLIVGVLRAGGDTRFSMLLDVVGTWLVSLPLVILAGLVFHAPFWVVYACTLTEDLPKLFVGIPRLRSRKWLNDLTERLPGGPGR